MEPCMGGMTTLLAIGSIVSVLHAVEREHQTIKESVWELHDKGGARRVNMSQGSHPRYHAGRLGSDHWCHY